MLQLMLPGQRCPGTHHTCAPPLIRRTCAPRHRALRSALRADTTAASAHAFNDVKGGFVRPPALSSAARSNPLHQQHLSAVRGPFPAAAASRNSTAALEKAPQQSPGDVVVGHLKWLLLVVGSLLFVWIAQALLLLVAATVGAKSFFRREDRSEFKPSDPPGLQHQTLDVNGLKLHCVSNGATDKPLMLFIHGFPELWYSWRHQLAEFQQDYHVAAFDMRGYGASEKPQDQAAYTIEKVVADVVAVMEALGHDRMTLVVHDWGGLIGWAVTATRPELVDRLVVIGLPHPIAFTDNMSFSQMRKSWYVSAYYAPLLPEQLLPADDLKIFDALFSTAGESGMGMRRRALDPEEIDRLSLFQLPGRLKYERTCQKLECTLLRLQGLYRNLLDNMTRGGAGSAFYQREQAALKAGIGTPTLMLYADKDIALGLPLLEGTEKYVSDLELHVLEDCSHFVQQDRPDEVNRLMRAWLARHNA